MGSRILGLQAGPDDKSLKDSFLEMDLNADDIRQFLSAPRGAEKEPPHKNFYHSPSRMASYVVLTDDRMVCLTVSNVTLGQADKIETGLKLNKNARWSLAPFQDVVEDTLGESVNPQHPKGSYIARWWRGPP
jgi:hypothetical protein